jgi:mersacidin/lichenicidin family type 2 lantibiotic
MSSMNSNEVITAWKQPAMRAGLADPDPIDMPPHPAGRSPFESESVSSAGGMLPSPIQTVGTLTSIMSCNLACSETMWDGSCDFFTYGCCA